jgi:exosortase family protein XrtM
MHPRETTAPAAAQKPLAWGFVAIFAAAYIVLYMAYSAVPDSFLRDKSYVYGSVNPSKTIIHWLAPGEPVTALQNRLQSPSGSLDIVRGCDGSGVVFLLVAAIIAMRERLRRTLLGIIGGIALIYLLNQLRIVTLYFVHARRPEWFTAMHVYFIPTLMVLVVTIYFAAWAARPTRDLEPAAET